MIRKVIIVINIFPTSEPNLILFLFFQKVFSGMNIKIKIAVLILINSLTIVACKHNPQPVQTPNTQLENERREAEKLRKRMNHRIVDTAIAKTSISFQQTTFDFGTINGGDVKRHNFAFTNSGVNPLVIFNVQGTCGCTVPGWSSKPISPGDTGHIAIEFDSGNERGLQNKKVRVLANTKPWETDISFTANIKK
jgi:hypothetical protein